MWFKKRKSNDEIFNELQSLTRQVFILLSNVREIRQDVLSTIHLGKSPQAEIAAIKKILSSIEMELLVSRGACLDNDFPGKTEM